jgi:CRP-like cAMP-binding protein
MTSGGSNWSHEPTERGGRSVLRQHISEQMELLRRAPLFEGLPKGHLRAIAEVSAARRFPPGKELVVQGAAGSVFFVIVEGTAKVVRNGRTVKRLEAGDFFGEMSVLTKAPRSAGVVAESALRCLTLSNSDLRAVLLREPAIAVRMLTKMAERLDEMDRRLTS